jgi:hypothetical protein
LGVVRLPGTEIIKSIKKVLCKLRSLVKLIQYDTAFFFIPPLKIVTFKNNLFPDKMLSCLIFYIRKKHAMINVPDYKLENSSLWPFLKTNYLILEWVFRKYLETIIKNSR